MPPITMTNAQSGRRTIQRDANGNAMGGFDYLTWPSLPHGPRGAGRFGGGGVIASPFSTAYLKTSMTKNSLNFYSNRTVFLEKYERELERCVQAGVILTEDVQSMRNRATQWAQKGFRPVNPLLVFTPRDHGKTIAQTVNRRPL
ncbi:MAG: hypothetical protein Ct9H300mP8_05660 [Gammaproteobacteria bacterium]|nr:MAG: hypothetical protein Ct9H300mP8_05660 [Gammaproteobacteria bacterium]